MPCLNIFGTDRLTGRWVKVPNPTSCTCMQSNNSTGNMWLPLDNSSPCTLSSRWLQTKIIQCSMTDSWEVSNFTLPLCSQMQFKHSGTWNCERALVVDLQSCALLPQCMCTGCCRVEQLQSCALLPQCTCTGCCRVEQPHETVQLLQRLLVYQWSRIPKLLYRGNHPLIMWLRSNHAWFELKSVQAEPLSCKNPRLLTYSGLAWLCELSSFNI